MLKSLYISSFVIIDKMRIDLDEGMSVLTGETGAGKSIIIDALGQLCGNRSSISLIRKNCSKAIVEGVFDVSITPALEKVCDELHIEPDEQFVISKEILSSGKSNIKINYQNASNSALKLLTPYLIDIHSQFETQKLFEEKNHIILLDEYASLKTTDLKTIYTKQYQTYKDLSLKLKNVIEEDMSDEQLDFLQSQLNEIDEMSYTDDEVDELENELKVLQNFEKINECIQSFDQNMNSSRGALSLMKDSLNSLQSVIGYGDFEGAYDSLYNLYYNVMDEYECIMDIYREYHFNEYRFNELQDILFKINRLKRKYGFTMERIAEKREELSEQINAILNREEYIRELESEVKNALNIALQTAQKIHDIRVEFASRFEKDIQKELKDLYMEKALFHVQMTETKLHSQGFDKIRFMVSINKGQDLSLLNESASGGEISRIMLAIKTVILRYNIIDTIVFDEVDTGVSGKVASSIGEKMRQLSKKKQVICITHLPQVACLAKYHYCIEKDDQNTETLTSVHCLEEHERVMEIAKMLSGEVITPEAIENAKQLLNV